MLIVEKNWHENFYVRKRQKYYDFSSCNAGMDKLFLPFNPVF